MTQRIVAAIVIYIYVCFVPYLTCKLLYQCSLNVETGFEYFGRMTGLGTPVLADKTTVSEAESRVIEQVKCVVAVAVSPHFLLATVRLFARQSASLLYEPCILSLLQNWDSYNHTGSEDIVNIPCC